MLYWSGMLFPYHKLMGHSRLSTIASGSPLLIWWRDTLQMIVDEAYFEKTAFSAGLSGLYEFYLYAIWIVQLWVHFLLTHGDVSTWSAIYDTSVIPRWHLCMCCQYQWDAGLYWTVDQMAGKFNLKLEPKEFQFFQHSVVFLGMYYIQMVSLQTPRNIHKVKNWLLSTNPKELQSFLGLVSYYHQFMPKFTAIAKYLYQFLGPTSNQGSSKSKKGEPLVNQFKETLNWTGKHQEAFDLLKSCLTSTLVLGYPDFNWPFELETDTSLQWLGVVLS